MTRFTDTFQFNWLNLSDKDLNENAFQVCHSEGFIVHVTGIQIAVYVFKKNTWNCIGFCPLTTHSIHACAYANQPTHIYCDKAELQIEILYCSPVIAIS